MKSVRHRITVLLAVMASCAVFGATFSSCLEGQAQTYSVKYGPTPALQPGVKFPVPLGGNATGTAMLMHELEKGRYMMLVAVPGNPPDLAVYYVTGDAQPTPPVPPTPPDYKKAAEELALAEAKKVADPATAKVLADLHEKIAERVPKELDTPDKLILANRFARVSLLDPAAQVKWEPWVQACGTWLDAKTKDGTLKTMDQYKEVWLALAAGLRRASQ